MGVDKYLGVSYKLTSSENFDEFMKAIGVNYATRKVAANVSITVTLTKEGDEYTVTTLSTFRNVVVKFKLGVEFDEETADGRKAKTTVTEEGDKLIQKQKSTIDSEIVREFSENELIITMRSQDVVCVRKLARVN